MTHSSNDLDIFARTLYGEARCEYGKVGIAALMAVGNVVLNRLGQKHFGASIADVCLKPWQFSCWNEKDPVRKVITGDDLEKDPVFRVCQDVARGIAFSSWPDLTKGSDHYHADYCRPYWAKSQKLRVRLGRHLFYRLESR